MSSAIEEAREKIDALNFEERVELTRLLQESIVIDESDPEWDAEGLRIAQERSDDIESGRVKALSAEEFWERIETDQYGDAEDAELDLAEKRDAELAAGTKKLVSEEEFWQQMQRFKATLQ